MRTRPSELVGIAETSDPLTIFCFDRAINTFGDALMGQLKGIDAKNNQEAERKTRTILMKWFPETRPGRSKTGPSKRSG
jgi:hypothetical protein